MTVPTLEDSYELSPLQHGMLFDSLAGGEPGVDIIQIACFLDEDADAGRLGRAWRRVVARHAVLRTAFRLLPSGEPVQDVHGGADLPFESLDLGAVPPDAIEARWSEIVDADRRRGFDLFRPPLTRLTLVRLGPGRQRLLWTTHHAVLDGEAVPQVLHEAFALYDAEREQRPVDLPAPRPFADYIRWQRGLDGTAAEAYWRAALRGIAAPTKVDLPRRAPVAGTEDLGLGVRRVRLSKDETARLAAFARESGITLSTLVHGAWAILLHHYSRDREVVFGSVRTLRHSMEGGGRIVGPLINTLPVRVRVDRAAGLEPWLRDLRAGQVALREHAHWPLSRVRSCSDVPPGTPLFESLVAFDFLTVDGATRALGGDWSRRRCELIGRSSFPLVLGAYAEPELLLEVKNDRRVLDDAAGADVLDQVRGLLEQMPARADRPVGTLSLLTPAQRNKIVLDLNDTDRPYPRDRGLHELVEAQAARTPGAVAVETEAGSLTYRDLDESANRLARHLRKNGVAPGELVGIAMERSLDVVVGLLAILKAGAAYVPLDPSYPADRLAFMVSDSGVPLVLTTERLAERVPTAGARVMAVDSRASEIARESAAPLERTAFGDALAYVIYTSGSTGRPKGAMNLHRGIVNRLLWMQDEYALGPEDAVLQKAPFSFDVSVWETFWPLLSGARLVMARPEGHMDPAYIARTIRERRVTTAQFVPAMLQAFLDEPSAGECASLRRVFSGGEALSVELRDLFFERLGCDLHNLYGPTETAVAVTFHPCRRDDRRRGVPIGRPLPNTRIYILDPWLEPVPAGAAGELHVGGVQVGRGYLRRPGLTAERFVPDPFSPEPGARLYRTGDLARWRPDGRIEYLGRLDHQVKVRGFRIELGEIESALAQCPGVRQAVVVARDAGARGAQLVAYVTSDAATPPSAAELRERLARSLPAYMVPAAFLFPGSFPRTPSGKVDRKALPAPDAADAPAPRPAAPMTPTEEIVAGVWSEVLGVEGIGVEDDFFERGGHSLLATQVVSRVRRALSVDLPLRDLFAESTVSRLARRIEALRETASRGAGAAGSEPIQRRGSLSRRELSAAERRLWFFDQVEPGSSAYNLGIRLNLTGALDRAALERSVGVLVERHETLRTSFRAEGGVPFAVVVPTASVEIPLVDLRDRPAGGGDAVAEHLVAEEMERPFDLGAGPLFRALLVRVTDDRHLLSLVLHHIVADGWSVEVLTRELLAAYQALASGRVPPLRPLPISYTDFACWESEWLLGSEAERQRAFWRARLAGPLPVVDLPADRPRPKAQTYRGGSCRCHLSPELDTQIAALCRGQAVTPFMAHLAAFGLLLYRLTGLEDLPVGVPLAGRGREELENLVGIFINTVVVRQDLSGDPTFIELLGRTRTLALDAYRHSQLPFDRVVEDLQPPRTAGRSPLFQVLVNSVDFSTSRRFELPGLVAELGGIVVRHSKFDLTLYLGSEAGRTKLVLAYNSDLFDEQRMVELLREYESLLERVVVAPDRPVSEISLVTDSARAVLPDPRRSLGGAGGPTVVESIVSGARRDPARVAVHGSSGTLTYAELERRSRWLSGHLAGLGVARGDVVAIHARRCVELVWAVLGVLRARAAFAILDASHPPSRIAECLRTAKPKALLRCPGLGPAPHETAASLPSLSLAYPGDGHSRRNEKPGASAGEGEGAPAADDVAYVAFTSGTTGGVKGVVGTHGPLSHFLRWHVETFGLAPEDRFSMLSGLAHDPLLRDLFTPLHLGASLFVPDSELLTSPDGLRAFMARAGITVAHLTPSLANLLAEGAAPGELPRLRYAFLAGDVLDGATVDRLHRLAPAVTVVNFYGATETPQAMGWHVVPREAPAAGLPLVPLGRGIDDVQLLVLSGGGELAGIGELGEIAIRTPHLARGYLDDEALTRGRFVANPFTGDPADRVYRTGDLGRFRPDGRVEFAGRRDGQVKIRGFRVELQAVESALREHPEVRRAAVLCHRGEAAGAAGEPRLAAYVTGEAGAPPIASDLRRFLRTRLPEYMVPATFVALESLPLTPNGKVDDRALARIPVAPAASAHVPPRTATERVVAGAWAEALGSGASSVDDSFFDAGGHSLAAARLIARLRATFGVALGVRSLFERPTIAGLSELIDALSISSGPGVPRDASSEREEFEF